MAETQGKGASIFRQSAMSRIASADDLDKYVRVTNPSAWLVLLAAAVFIGGLVIWSLTAVIPTTVSLTGLYVDGEVVCWVNEDVAQKLKTGNGRATILGEEVSDLEVSDVPWSRSEVDNYLTSDYLAQSVSTEDWNYLVQLGCPDGLKKETETRPVPVTITVSETRPLDLVLGKQ